MLQSPVLFLIFNRPDTTFRVFEAIRQAKPRRLFIAADGPRPDVPGEEAICSGLRQQLLAWIDWDCQVETLFRPANLGCEAAVASAISWFFSQVEQGIILEDDCLPAADFFPYCQDMLARYRSCSEVAMVSGASFLGADERPEPYFFSLYYGIWGWATWKDRWEGLYRRGMPGWQERKRKNWLRQVFARPFIVYFYTAIFDKMARGLVDTWDSNWNYSLLCRDMLAVTPTANLVANIGVEGTHSARAEQGIFNLPTGRYRPSAFRPAALVRHDVLDAIQFRKAGVDVFRWKIMARFFLDKAGLLGPAMRLKAWFGW